jgi:DNA-binding LytR/AlgR family response regulator
MSQPKAIIADDEEQLRIHLKSQLLVSWPELVIGGEAANGIEALELIRATQPDVAFLDIRMPGLTGIEVAAKCAGDCHVVFITAFDQYAVKAFEKGALDYVLKPVTASRLEKTIERLQKRMVMPRRQEAELRDALERVLLGMGSKRPTEYVRWIKVLQGDSVTLIPVEEVCYFKAGDKYTVVMTKKGESLIRKSIKSLEEELDPTQFWRVHRGTIVNVSQIAKVSRSLAGRSIIALKDLPHTLSASRSYSYLFKQM